MIPTEIEDAFYSKNENLGLAFFVNDYVEIVGKEGYESRGFVISLVNLVPEQEYHVEYMNGKSDLFKASSLKKCPV